MIRHTVHDSASFILTVEVDVGIVSIHVRWAWHAGAHVDCSAAIHMAPAAARDRKRFSRALAAAEAVNGVEESGSMPHHRKIPIDVIARSIADITKKPSA